MTLYPLKFRPRLIPKIWGGRKLAELLGKPLPKGDQPFGESWELYDFPPGATGPDDDPGGWISSPVVNGPLEGRTVHDLMQAHPRELLGACAPSDTPHGPQFPLLVKFLDARQDLSVQVHPPAEYAARHANAFVKNEAWHVIAVDKGARLLLGAKTGVTRQRLERSLRGDAGAGRPEDLVNSVPVAPGETFYMPSGTLHALGGGIVAYEVQTPSDTTYRVYDFNRIDPKTGKGRALHVEQAMECIYFDWDALKYRAPRLEGDRVLARAPQWMLKQVNLAGGVEVRFDHDTGPIAATVMHGSGEIGSGGRNERFQLGETFLLPPSADTRIRPKEDVRLLLAAVPPMDEDDLRPRRG
jgi:mannose-6-phosphate isomerase